MNFKEFLIESANIKVTATDNLNNEYTLIVFGGKTVKLMNSSNGGRSLDSINFNMKDENGKSIRSKGYAAAGEAVKVLALSAKSSKDLAKKLNASDMGFTNWKAA